MNRRQLLKAIIASGAATTLPWVNTVRAQAILPGDYKALVSIFLFGGNDSFNLIAPRSPAEYNVYAQSRQNLAIDQADLLPIVSDNPDGALYGFHPAASGLRSLFDEGDLAVVANIGPLIQPTTKTQLQALSVALPPQLFSHNDQQGQWQTLRGISQVRSGWAGRVADYFDGAQPNASLAMNISMSGNSMLLSGESAIPYAMSPDGAIAYGALSGDAEFAAARLTSFEAQLQRAYANAHSRAFQAIHRRALASADTVNTALAKAPVLNTAFPNSGLGRQLQAVARMLAVRDEFGAQRQIFATSMGGFDTHDRQNQEQPELFMEISEAMHAFQLALRELGLQDQVTTFTQSDFGRTLTSNGDGTDHGWGSHQVVMGGAVAGRRIVGTMPLLEIDGPDDVSGGRMIPTTSSDQYAASLARWFGVDDAALLDMMPSLANFEQRDVGLFSG
jgi:uncharacterized protein (DUF1501 family)